MQHATVNGFFDGLVNVLSEAGRYIQQAQQSNIPVVNTYSVPQPLTTDAYSLNRYANDVKEQTPQYQAQQLEQIKQQQNINLAIAAAVGIVAAAIIFK